MPQVAYTLSCPPDPFDVQAAGGTTVSVCAAADITVNWDPGTPSLITATPPTQAKTPGGVAAVDATLDLYLIVAQVGLATLTLIKLADALASSIDTVLGGTSSWGIIGELTHNRVREHPQMGDSGRGVLTTEGDLLTHEGGIDVRDAIGTPADILTTVLEFGTLRHARWRSLASLLAGSGLPITPGTPVVIRSSAAGQGTILTVSPPAGVPAGWFAVGYTPTGWDTPQAVPQPYKLPPLTGTTWICDNPAFHANNGEYLLFRDVWTPVSVPAALFLVVQADDTIINVYLNGTALAGTLGVDVASYAIPPGALAVGVSATLAIQVRDAPPSSGGNGRDGLDYAIQTNPPPTLSPTALGPIGSVPATPGAPINTAASAVGVGTIFAATLGTEPAGWQNPGFNDSGWAAPVTTPPGSGRPAFPGTAWISKTSTFHPTNPAETLLYRTTVTAPADLTGLALQIQADDIIIGAWVNGTALTGTLVPGTATMTYPVGSPTVTPGGTLLLAIEIQDAAPSSGGNGYDGLDYALSQSGGATIPPSSIGAGGAAEGALLIFKAGAWIPLAPAADGSELKMVSGYPAWVIEA